MRFDQHTVVLLVRPPDAPELPPEALDRLQNAHLAHQAGLVEQGLVLAAGPFVDADDERLRGFVVLSISPDEARELYANDPAVRAGRLAVQVMSWMVPEGILRFESVPVPRSMLEAATDRRPRAGQDRGSAGARGRCRPVGQLVRPGVRPGQEFADRHDPEGVHRPDDHPDLGEVVTQHLAAAPARRQHLPPPVPHADDRLQLGDTLRGGGTDRDDLGAQVTGGVADVHPAEDPPVGGPRGRRHGVPVAAAAQLRHRHGGLHQRPVGVPHRHGPAPVVDVGGQL
jgi:uncharacterized protein YciI